jgi:SAM-dependent methyltransferase
MTPRGPQSAPSRAHRSTRCCCSADIDSRPRAGGCKIAGMRSFDDLVREAEEADVTGWGFGWLAGRAIEERPPWGYARMLAERLGRARTALDIDTGGGEVLAEAPTLPARMCVTEAWPPNLARARELLEPRGVEVHEASGDGELPFPGESFDLVTSRHPVRPAFEEVHRVLKPGGVYFAQHVGPASAFELIEFFLGPLPEQRRARDPRDESVAAELAGLTVTDLRTARCRMEFFDIGAVVWTLRKCVWWVPDFSVTRYHDKLVELDARIRIDGPFVAHSSRHLIEAKR